MQEKTKNLYPYKKTMDYTNLNYDSTIIDDNSKKLWQLMQRYNSQPFATANFYSEFAFALTELSRQVAVMNYCVVRNKAKYNTERTAKWVELSAKFKEETGKDISMAQLDRELDVVYAENIEKIKIDSAYAEMQDNIVKAYKIFLDSIKTELISEMAINKNNETAERVQNNIDDNLPF